jgi:hypothetical protein
MIISKIIGGLGNQMFQYAIAKAVEVKKSDTFKLDITAYKTYKLHNGYRLNKFNIDENIANKEEIENFKGKNNLINKVLNKFNLNKIVYKEKERTIYDKNVFCKDNIYLDGYWQNEKYFIDIRDEILKDFTPKEKNTIEVDKYLEKINSVNSVSIHIRRGDYANHPEIGILDISYYKNAIKYICTKVEKPIFYIFSNDLKWCEKNFDFIENKFFINDTKTEIEDMTLMKNCKHNILANSSFSWWSAWLNIYKEKIVIAPKKWRLDDLNNYKYLPKSWIKI